MSRMKTWQAFVLAAVAAAILAFVAWRSVGGGAPAAVVPEPMRGPLPAGAGNGQGAPVPPAGFRGAPPAQVRRM
ncbi:MAG: hypothetical protein IT208_08275 [Chthonomonadales bacterium]|nr:hypothetical protein [Chthonomonadales bacterium]